MRRFAAYLTFSLLLSCGGPRVGQVLPAWQPGELDIHAVCTGRGECFFYILPDGTTMVVDCGEIPEKEGSVTSHDPYGDRDIRRRQVARLCPDQPAHAVAGAYIRHFLPAGDSLDCLVLTHHHDDHMSGIAGVWDEVPFRVLVDRADTASIAADAALSRPTARYMDFIRTSGVRVVPFEVGAVATFGGAEIRNLCGSGLVWTLPEGETDWSAGTAVDAYQGRKLSENGASTGFLLSYGAFDWLATGDAGDPNSRVAWPLTQTVGRPVEAMKVPHHFSWKTLSPRMLDVLQPEVLVSENFWSHQPWRRELQNWKEAVYEPGRGKHLFLTSPYRGEVEDNAYTDAELAALDGTDGHVVIRVGPGGRDYRVYLVDATTQEYRIIRRYGPFACR